MTYHMSEASGASEAREASVRKTTGRPANTEFRPVEW